MRYPSGYCPVCLHTECKCWQIFNQGHFNKTTIQTPSEGGEGSGGKKNINTNDPKPSIDIPQVLHKAHVMRWLDFIEQQPKHNQLVLIKDLETGQVTEEVWKADFDYPPFSRVNSVWFPSPAIA